MPDPSPESASSPAESPAASRPQPAMARPPGTQRVLACALCQQRKVKCSRTFPCTNCVRSGASCVPAMLLPRRRRRRFPERELLERLRMYERLLRKSKVPFTSIFAREDGTDGTDGADGADGADGTEGGAGSDGGGRDLHRSASDDAMQDSSPPQDGHSVRPVHQNAEHHKFKSFFWTAIKQFGSTRVREGSHDEDGDGDGDGDGERFSSDDERPNAKSPSAPGQVAQASRLFLRSSRGPAAGSVSMLHPAPAQLLRLWQVYLDNVDPLLKVTHTPTLQPRVIEAAGRLAGAPAGHAAVVDPTVEALLFSIYCIAVHSMTAADCESVFSSTKDELLAAYQSACEQALANAGLLSTRDRECLTAFLLYLMSLNATFYDGALYPMLGIAVRIGQRMQLDTEKPEATFPPLEAELRRRLWWVLTLFDARVGELTSFRPICFEPTWTCRPPRNVNDSALRVEQREPPAVQGPVSEALFAVVRSEVGNCIRRAPFYLALTNPALLPLAWTNTNGASSQTEARESPAAAAADAVPLSTLDALEDKIENAYLRHCDPSNGLHFMTIWTVRSTISKYRLIELFTQASRPGDSGGGVSADGKSRRTERERERALADAFRMLESDTHIMGSPCTRGFRWMAQSHFPLPAYVHVTQELAERLDGPRADKAWDLICANYEARVAYYGRGKQHLTKLLARIVLRAWEQYLARHRAAPGAEGSTVAAADPDMAAAESDAQQPHTAAEVPVPRIVMLLRQEVAAAPAANENAAAATAASTAAANATTAALAAAASSDADKTAPVATDGSNLDLTPATSSLADAGGLVPTDIDPTGAYYGGWPLGSPKSTLMPGGVLGDAGFAGDPSLLSDPGLSMSPSVPLGMDALAWGWRPPVPWTWGQCPTWGG